jgi:two-component system, LytTR family, sensor kinase
MILKLPQYSGKDYLVLLYVIMPFTLIMNYAIFGANYFSSPRYFLYITLVTAFAFSIDFVICGVIAVTLKQRFPTEEQLSKRLGFMIVTFLLITGLFLAALFRGFEKLGYYNYSFNRNAFVWAYFGMGIGNVFLTFLMEGISRYENWKQNMKETDELKKSYRQSQLLGLKSQVNPHFLFNSLNSLSSLIHEDEEKAERFLDEMSKVYRYMLRNDDDQLVTLDTELKFIESYLYLLKTRYGQGLDISIDIRDEYRTMMLPPLSLQVIIENALNQNTINKNSPLLLAIYIADNGNLVVKNNVQPKIIAEPMVREPGLANLVNKYLLLNQPNVIINDSSAERTVELPLIRNKEEILI